MNGSEPILAIDIGTTKVCGLLAIIGEEERPEIVGVGLAPSTGLYRGAVVDLDVTTNAVREAVNQVFSTPSGVRRRQAVVGIAGGFIRSYNGHGSVVVNNRSRGVTSHDIQAAIRDAVQKEVPSEMEVIHALPREFRLDDTAGVRDPLGMQGTLLEVDLHLVAGLRSALRNVKRAVRNAGLRVEGLALEPLASSLAVLTEEEKSAGVAMVDIGGGTTDLAVFTDGLIRHSEVILVGGDYITKDLSKAFVTPFERAEALKLRFAAASADTGQPGEQVDIQRARKSQMTCVSRQQFNWVVEARVEQILGEVKRSLGDRFFCDQLGGGVVLTGGTALLEGIREKATTCLEREVEIGFPDGVGGYDEIIRNPIYSTAIGLIHYGLAERKRRHVGRSPWRVPWDWFARFLQDNF